MGFKSIKKGGNRENKTSNFNINISIINIKKSKQKMKEKTNWLKLLLEIGRVIIAFFAGAGGAQL